MTTLALRERGKKSPLDLAMSDILEGKVREREELETVLEACLRPPVATVENEGRGEGGSKVSV